MKNFYLKFQIFSRFPLWRNYLKKVYTSAKLDQRKFNIELISKRKTFTVLLSGVASEITADEFIKAVLLERSDAKLKIIDLGSEQVNSVKKLVEKRYKHIDVEVRQANALNLNFIKDKSIDWIDTDGFFGFFDEEKLTELLHEWKRILKDDGFITFRELIPQSLLGEVVDRVRAVGAKLYMGIDFNKHTVFELKNDFKKLGFAYSWSSGFIPFFSRFCLVKK